MLVFSSTTGQRYKLEKGLGNKPLSKSSRLEALSFVKSLTRSDLQRVHHHFFGYGRAIYNPVMLGGTRLSEMGSAARKLTPQLIDIPIDISGQQKDIYLALVNNELVLEPAPLSLEEINSETSLLRQKIRLGLKQIIAEEQAEYARIDAQHQQRSTLGKVGAHAQAIGSGLGEAAWGLAVWVKDIADVAHKVSPIYLTNAATKSAYNYVVHDKSLTESKNEYLTGLKKEVVDVLGFDPSAITRAQFDQAMEVATLIYDDPVLQRMIGDFAKAYVDAQHSLEWSEFAGGGVFEIILTIVLTVFTAGAGAAVGIAKNARLLKRFEKLGDLMMDFAHLQKNRLKAPKKKLSKGSKADLSQLESVESRVSPSALGKDKTSASKPATTSSNKVDSKPAEPDKANTNTGKNADGDTTQNNDKAVEGGEPINLKTGEERLTLVDAVLDGPLPLTLARTYRSGNPQNSSLGYGWSHPLAEKLQINSPKGPITFQDAEGRVIEFPMPGGSGRSHNIVESLTLTKLREHHWVITPYGAPEGLQKHFKQHTGSQGELDLSEIHDGYGNHYRFHFSDDAQHGQRLAWIESSLGDALHLKPSPCGRIGKVIRESGDGQKSTLAHYRYNEHGDLIQAIDANGHSEYYQYHQHVITQRTLKTGYNFYFEWDREGPGAKCVRQWGDDIHGVPTYQYQFAWDNDGNGVTVTDTRGGTEVYRFNDRALPVYHKDQSGAETHYHYNDLGQLLQKDLPGNGDQRFNEAYEYDTQGRLTKKTDVGGSEHRIAYNAQGLPHKLTNPEGHTWQRRYNGKGQITATTDPLGNTTRYSYNPIGLIGSVTDPLGNSTRYLWNNHGKLTAVQDPLGRSQHYVYDNAQRLIEVKHGPGQSTFYQYDNLDRISAVTAPDGAKSQYEYNEQGLVAEIIDVEGRTTCYTYDGLSQVSKRINPDGTELKYHYDGERNLVGLTNENGEKYQLKYDLSERLIEEVGFDGRTTRYAYNQAGHLIASRAVVDRQSGSGIDTHFERDPFGRLLRETTPEGVNEFCYNSAGMLVQAENQHRRLQWEYDASGRVISDQQGFDKLHHQYDAAGNRIQTTLPSGEVLKFGFNAAGQFQHLSHRPLGFKVDELITQVDHDELGREISRQHGNGLLSKSSYDPQGRLQQHTLFKAQQDQGAVSDPTRDIAASVIQSKQYQYNASGQISRIDDSLRGSKHYVYDALDRLTQVKGPQPEYFVHDPAHNVLAAANSERDAQQQASQSQVQGNRLAFRGDTHYWYDQHGNRSASMRGTAQKLQTRYFYNSRHQLTKIEKGKNGKKESEVTFQYDPLGRRIGKTSADKHVDFLWDGDVLLRETEHPKQPGKNLHERLYFFEPGSFKPIALSDEGRIYHYHLDHLGTPDTVTDKNGEIAWSVSYQTYGNLALRHAEESFHQPLRFQVQYHDEETGLHYNRFRYYDPSIGQFITQDPVGLLGGVNNYQYAPNPIKWIDPTGLSCKEYGISSAKMDELKDLVAKDPERAYFKLNNMIKNNELDFSTSKDGAVFWSGGKMETAQKWAATNGKTTLEQTKGGRVLADLKLFENSGFSNSQAAKLWNKASNKFASQASGDLNAFSTGATRYGDYGERTWWRIEKPILENNDAVSSVTRRKVDGKPSKTGHLRKD